MEEEMCLTSIYLLASVVNLVTLFFIPIAKLYHLFVRPHILFALSSPLCQWKEAMIKGRKRLMEIWQAIGIVELNVEREVTTPYSRNCGKCKLTFNLTFS